MRDRVSSRRRGPTTTATLIVIGVVALSLSAFFQVSPTSSAISGPSTLTSVLHPSSQSWNNGRVALSFANDHPSFSVASLSTPSFSVSQTLTGLAEVSPTDTILSFGSFTANTVTWQMSATSDPHGTDVTLNATVPVVASGGEWESGDDSGGGNVSIGAANVTITFALNASTSSNPWSVSYTLNVSDWPWLQSADSVGVEVRSNLTSATGYWVAAGTNQLNEVARSNLQPVASFVWGATATAQYSDKSSQDSSVGAYRNLSADGSSFLVRLEFGPVTGGYTSLSYDPWLGIVPTSGSLGKLAAWVLTPTTLAVIAGGSAATILLAIVARARRLPPESGL